ncbi:hypothetical protein ACFW6S_14660 [Streptomyces sp. NPDC058740]|uniref:hypothetical protein n=1 Tax=Streptomyces sp. NPDC058740 TaxID=3346619 RepID=UPI0036B0A817
MAAATLVAPAGATGTPGATVAEGDTGPGPGAAAGARLSTGGTARIDRGGLRVTGPGDAPSGPYSYVRVGGRTEVTPAGRQAPQATTALGGPATAPAGTAPSAPSALTPRATASPTATPNQRVRIQLVNADNWGPLIHVWNRRTWQYYDVAEQQWDTYGTVGLPPGDYLTIGDFSTWGRDTYFLAKTFTVGGSALTVSLDARQSKPVRIAVDDPSATRATSSVWYTLPNGDLAGFAGGWGNQVYVSPLTLSGVNLKIHDVLERKGSSGNRPSPYRYDLVHTFANGVPATPVVQVRTADLALTRPWVKAPGAGLSAALSVVPRNNDSSAVYLPTTVPAAAAFRHYLTPGQPFARDFRLGSLEFGLPDVALPKGENPNETLGQAPYSGQPGWGSSSYRSGTFYLDETSPLADAAGRRGTDLDASSVYRVSADGTPLVDSGLRTGWDSDLQVPAGSYQSYTIRHTVTQRGTANRLSPRVETEWTFPRSALPPSRTSALPVLDAAFSVPGLDARNRAAAGPATVRTTLTSRVGAAPTLTSVEYSFDDGASWQTAPLTADGATGTATLDVPATAGFVSLRVGGKDDAGGTVVRTVTRAFAGPGAQTTLKAGTLTVGTVVVNNARPITPRLSDPMPYEARFTVSGATSALKAGLTFRHGTYTAPDGLLDTGEATCTKRATGTVHDCVARFELAAEHLGLNRLAGTWSVDAWAHSANGGLHQGPVGGQVTFKRSTSLTITATPQPVTRGGTLTVSGRLSGAAWEYGAPTGLAGQKVELQFRKAGTGTTWSTVAAGRTGSTGVVTLRRAAWSDGAWRLHYAGSTSTVGSYSWADNVDVR